MTEPRPDQLTPDQLMRCLRDRLCKPAHRPGLFGKNYSPAHALSRLIRLVVACRSELVPAATVDGESARVRDILLRTGFKDGYGETSMKRFKDDGLIGVKSPGIWISSGPQVLRATLLDGLSDDAVQARETAEVIGKYFFGEGYEKSEEKDFSADSSWYFDRRLAYSAFPVRTTEAIEELHRIGYHCEHRGGRGLVVRVSGFSRFLVVDPASRRLNEAGRVTLDLLRRGVSVVHVIPADSPEARASSLASDFEALVPDDLRAGFATVAIDPDQRPVSQPAVWPGQHFSRVLRHTYHVCHPQPDEAESSWLPWRNLLICRHSRTAASLYKTGSEECDDFEQWCKAFVPPAAEWFSLG